MKELPPGRPEFPTAEHVARIGRLMQLLDEQRRVQGTPPTSQTQVDRAALEKLGYSSEEIDAAIATNASWETLALRTHGRIGRDPARIWPFLHRFEQTWSHHPGRRFLELVCEVVKQTWGAPRLFAPEDDAFIEALGAWERAQPRTAPARGTSGRMLEARDLRIYGLLRRLGEAWEKEPDQRFGQLVSNVVRSRDESLCELGDEDFLSMLSDWRARP